MNVGAMIVTDPSKGLSVDAHVLYESVKNVVNMNFFPVECLPPSEDPKDVIATGNCNIVASVASQGCSFTDWLNTAKLDAMVFIEFIPRGCAELCRTKGVRTILIVNLDWATMDYNVEGQSMVWGRWIKDNGIELWAKSKSSAEWLRALGHDVSLETWTTRFSPVCPEPPQPRREPFTFLFNGGTLRRTGYGTRRNVETAVEAFKIAQQLHQAPLNLVVKVIAAPSECQWLVELCDLENVRLVHGQFSQDQMDALHRSVDCVLYPSRWEGFGLSCLEALHAGKPVICTDGVPMKEIVTDGHDGIHVAATDVGWHNLARRYEIKAEDFAQAMLRIASDERLLARLTMPDQTELKSRHRKARADIRHALTGLRTKILVVGPTSPTQRKRSERFWAETLEGMGFDVVYAAAENEPEVVELCEGGDYAFVLSGKVRVELAEKMKAATHGVRKKLVLWVHDYAHFTPERAEHFDELRKHADLYYGADATHKFHEMTARVLTQGVSLFTDRGAGKRGSYRSHDGYGGGVVFTGNKYTVGCGARRNALVERLASHGVQVYGRGWSDDDTSVDAKGQAQVYASADLILCMSATNSERWLTSNRLVDALASGKRLLVERFPGIEDIVPEPAYYTSFDSHTVAFEEVEVARLRPKWLRFSDRVQAELNAFVAYNHLSWRGDGRARFK